MIRVVLALVVGGVCTAGAWFALDSVERGAQQEMYDEHFTRIEMLTHLRVDALVNQVEDMGLFAERRVVEGGVFTPALAARAKSNKAFRAIAWMPFITDRAAFEAQVGALAPGFVLTELGKDGKLHPAGEAQGWLPFLLVQPKDGADGLLGMDIGNQPLLSEAMDRSAREKRLAATTPQVFPGAEEPAILMLRYVPEPIGFVSALVSPRALMEMLLEDRPKGLVARLKDASNMTVYAEEEGFDATKERNVTFSVGGRPYTLSVSPTADYVPITVNGRQGVLFAGAGLSLLLVAFVLLGAPRESR